MKRITRGKAIQLFCHECCGWDARRRPDGKSLISYISAGYEVSKCESKICPLWPFRNGVEQNESIPHKKKSSYSTTHVKVESKSRQRGEKISQDGVNSPQL